MTRTPDVMAGLSAQHQELSALLDGLGEADWRRPTRCEGWDVADVVLHLAQTDELAIASLEDRFADSLSALADRTTGGTVDDGAAAMVAAERALPSAAIHRRWRDGTQRLRGLLDAADPHRRVQWVAGLLSVQTLAATRLAEAWIHTGDVAGAVGAPLTPDDRLRHVARLAWRTLPYAFARGGRELAGPVTFELQGPGGERWDFVPDEEPVTMIRGNGVELCEVAARRVDPGATSLQGSGPDADAVLALVRTYA